MMACNVSEAISISEKSAPQEDCSGKSTYCRCPADQALQEVEIALRYVKIVVIMVRHLTAELSIKL